MVELLWLRHTMEFGPSYTSKRHKNGWSTTCLLVKGMWAKFNRFATICIENCITSATLGNASMKTISKTLTAVELSSGANQNRAFIGSGRLLLDCATYAQAVC